MYLPWYVVPLVLVGNILLAVVLTRCTPPAGFAARLARGSAVFLGLLYGAFYLWSWTDPYGYDRGTREYISPSAAWLWAGWFSGIVASYTYVPVLMILALINAFRPGPDNAAGRGAGR